MSQPGTATRPLSSNDDATAINAPAGDVLVLGAGIVGVSTALHLQARGCRVCLVDRDQPGQGTSYGNAGLIERASVIPYAFPHDFAQVLRFGLNRNSAVHYQPAALPGLATWLWRYWRESGRTRLAQAAADMLPLIERCVDEHDALVRQAGLQALVASTGLIDLYRDPAAYATARNEARALQHYGLSYDTLDAAKLHELEPGLASGVAGGILWKDPWAVRDPAGLVKGYAQLFMQRGGQFVQASIESLAQHNPGWALTLDNGQTLCAQRAVVALGPDAPTVLEPLGYRFPLIHKRGYHLHFRPLPSTPPLRHPICDSQAGYVLAPMRQGIRLATGVELARTNSPPTPVQVERARVIAQRVYPLGEPVETQPWMGRRPCLPDMRPVIGPAPRHEGLWLNFGHAHHGLTLGPITGRLLAELMTRARPVVDPAPYAATRFPEN